MALHVASDLSAFNLVFSSFNYILQFLTLKILNKTKKQIIELLLQYLLIGKLKNIFHNL